MPNPGASRNHGGTLAAEIAGKRRRRHYLIARRYEWDLDQLWQALLGHLDSLPHSVARRPSLSAPLLGLLQAAWLIASLEENDSTIRSVHLLQALLNQPGWLSASQAWPLLSLTAVQLERLRPLLDEQSDERPELQTQADEAALTASRQSDVIRQSASGNAPASVNEPQTAGRAALEKFTIGSGAERYRPAAARREDRSDVGERPAGGIPAGWAERRR